MVLLSRSDEVSVSSLADILRDPRIPAGPGAIEMPANPVETEGLSLETMERQMIVRALRKFDWNKSQAARHLDISRKTLMYRIAKYNIEKEAGRNPPHQLGKTSGEEE
jgi:DNA-binding NtrC family response regulator